MRGRDNPRARPRNHRGRSLVAIGAALATTLAIAACTDGDDAGQNGNGNGGDVVTLRFSWWGGDARHEATQQIIDAFEAEYDNIRIEPDFTDWGSYWDRLSTATAGGNIPDIMTQEERYMTAYAADGRLLDLNQVSDVLNLAGLDPAALPGGQINGAQVGVATGVNAFTIVADPQIFDEAGVPMPDDTTWSWDDFVSIAEEISASGEVYGAQAIGANEAGFNAYARQRGEALYNEDGTLGFSAQTLADYWSIWLQLVNDGGAPEASLTVEVGGSSLDESLLATNQGAMGPWWTNQLGALSGAAGRDLVLLRQPGGAPGMYFKPAMYYSISASTDHPEEAALFVDFLLHSDTAIDIMLTDRGLPADLAQRERIVADLPEAEQQVAAFMAEIADEVGPVPPPPPNGAGDIPDILTRLFEGVIFEQQTPLEAAEQFIQEAEAAIS